MYVPQGKVMSSFGAFVNLPTNDKHCLTIVMIKGMWYWCSKFSVKVLNSTGME